MSASSTASGGDSDGRPGGDRGLHACPAAVVTAINRKSLGARKMSYYLDTTVDMPFEQAIEKVTAALKEEGFGVLTEIDVRATLKKKLDVDFRRYQILGACNPQYAHQALQSERMIGAMLPCNVIVQETDGGSTQVAAIDPIASMQAVDNPKLADIAVVIQGKLRKVIESLAQG
jgi:uncharacterized protein (DUF302 family)